MYNALSTFLEYTRFYISSLYRLLLLVSKIVESLQCILNESYLSTLGIIKMISDAFLIFFIYFNQSSINIFNVIYFLNFIMDKTLLKRVL